MSATSVIVLEEDMNLMNYANERLYQKTMMVLKQLHQQKFITKEEYQKMEKVFQEKYQPKISVLFP